MRAVNAACDPIKRVAKRNLSSVLVSCPQRQETGTEEITVSVSINLGNIPTKPTITQCDEAMREVSEVLGVRWTVTRVSGYWVFVGAGGGHHQSRRGFLHALADATGLAVTREIP